MVAQIGSAKALWELAEQDESVQECVNARVREAEAGGALARGCHRLVDGAEGVFAEDTIVAQALDLEETPIGGKADRAQFGEIV